MNKRWKPRKMTVIEWAGRWFAVDEDYQAGWFGSHEEAMDFVWRNWDVCYHCEEYVPWGGAQAHDVCRSCGRRWGSDVSVYEEAVEHLAQALYETVYHGMKLADATQDFKDNYKADAEEVILLHPHLLPLDVREAMLVEPDSRLTCTDICCTGSFS